MNSVHLLRSTVCGAAGLLLLAERPATGDLLVASFDDVPVPSHPIYSVLTGGVNVESDGFLPFFINEGPNSCIPQCVDSGSQYLMMQVLTQYVSLELPSRAPFRLLSFEYAELILPGGHSPGVMATGYRSDGTTVSAAFTLDGLFDGDGPLTDFQTAILPSSFSDLVRVEFRPLEPRFGVSLDSIRLDSMLIPLVPVSSPGYSILLACVLAAAGLAVIRSRGAV